jgi:hypothetical protein
MVWDDCALRNGEWTAESSTAYWLRVPRDEVDDIVRYASDPQAQAESVAEEQSGGEYAYFLVSDDLMSIVNMPEYYPISGQCRLSQNDHGYLNAPS